MILSKLTKFEIPRSFGPEMSHQKNATAVPYNILQHLVDEGPGWIGVQHDVRAPMKIKGVVALRSRVGGICGIVAR